METPPKGFKASIYKIFNGKKEQSTLQRIMDIMQGKGYDVGVVPADMKSFSVRVYSRRIWKDKAPSDMLRQFGISDKMESRSSYDVIAFYHKPSCIFALTKGYAYNTVTRYCDPDFPQAVAARLLTKPGARDITGRMLMGNTRVHSRKLKTSETTDPFTLTLYTKMVSSLRQRKKQAYARNKMTEDDENASIYKLPFMCDEFENPLDTRVTVGFGYVKFHMALSSLQYVEILEHLETIYDSKERTNVYKPSTGVNIPEDDSDAYKQFIQQVPKEMVSSLNMALVKLLKKGKADPGVVSHFDLCCRSDKDIKRFDSSSAFYLKKKNPRKAGGDPPKEGESRPKEVAFKPKRYDFKPGLSQLLQDITFAKDENKLVDDFQKYRFSFVAEVSSGGYHEKPDLLLNFIEGDIFHGGQFYWRVMGMWCLVMSDLLPDKEFVQILKDHLLLPTDPLVLGKVWSAKEHEDDYNLKYDGVDNFTVGDKQTENTIEVFDLMRVMKQNTDSMSSVLYHVKRDLGQTTRDVCSQLINSVHIIRDSSYSEKNDDTLRALYDKLTCYKYKAPNPTKRLKGGKRLSAKNFKNENQKQFELTLAKAVEQEGTRRQRINRNKARFPDWADFRDSLKKPTYVLAIAPSNRLTADAQGAKIQDTKFMKLSDRVASRTLQLEKQLLFTVKVTQFIEYSLGYQACGHSGGVEEFCSALLDKIMDPPEKIRQDVRQCLAGEIVRLLKKNEYIDGKGQVTVKLLYCTLEAFRLEDSNNRRINKDATDRIFRLLNPYRSFFPSLGAKLTIVRLHKILKEMGLLKDFKICEIRTMEGNSEISNSSGDVPCNLEANSSQQRSEEDTMGSLGVSQMTFMDDLGVNDKDANVVRQNTCDESYREMGFSLPTVTSKNAANTHLHVENLQLSLVDLKSLTSEHSSAEQSVLKKATPGAQADPRFLTDKIIDVILRIKAGNDSTSMEVPVVHLVCFTEQKFAVQPGGWTAYENVFIPLNSEQHWMLLVVKPKDRLVLFLDPRENPIPMFVTENIVPELKRILGAQELVIQTPMKSLQKDSWNCGVYIIKYAEAILKNESLYATFNASEYREELLQDIWRNSKEYALSLKEGHQS